LHGKEKIAGVGSGHASRKQPVRRGGVFRVIEMHRVRAFAQRAVSAGPQLAAYAWPHWVKPTVRDVVIRPGAREILPGIWHWTRTHPKIRIAVSSYYVEPAAVLLDPLMPRDGLEWFEGRRRPEQVVMTIRHHLREGERFVEEFGCELRCHAAGMHEFEGGPDVRPFEFGDALAPGVTAHEVDAISPEETALHIEHGGGAIAFGDGLTRARGGSLRFVPDPLIGKGADRVKRELTAAFERLLDLDFDTLLFPHGEPLVGGGKQALRDFVSSR
jgi:hypothetical protein